MSSPRSLRKEASLQKGDPVGASIFFGPGHHRLKPGELLDVRADLFGQLGRLLAEGDLTSLFLHHSGQNTLARPIPLEFFDPIAYAQCRAR